MKLTQEQKSDLQEFGFSVTFWKKSHSGTSHYKAVFPNYLFEGTDRKDRVQAAKAFLEDPRISNFTNTRWMPRQQPVEEDSTMFVFSKAS